MTKMRRTENVAWIRPDEVFYDGVLMVHDDMVEIPSGKEHWELALLLRGWEVIPENSEDDASVPPQEEKSPPALKRKVTNGKSNE